MKIIKPLRWTINKAASEFGLGYKGLSSSIKTKSIRPGRDGRFSTGQIVKAIFDSDYEERLRLVKESADHKALQNAELRESLIDVEDFADHLRKPLMLRIPMKADTCSNPYRTPFRACRTVVGAKRRSEGVINGCPTGVKVLPLVSC